MAISKLLIPPKKVTGRRGVFVLGASCVLASPSSADLTPLGQLREDLRSVGVAKARIERNAFGPATVRIRRTTSSGMGP